MQGVAHEAAGAKATTEAGGRGQVTKDTEGSVGADVDGILNDRPTSSDQAGSRHVIRGVPGGVGFLPSIPLIGRGSL